ncbi:hypothetical protein [Clostridioides difficile]|nr:hypothetical protein [Clostridioides difficile]
MKNKYEEEGKWWKEEIENGGNEKENKREKEEGDSIGKKVEE